MARLSRAERIEQKCAEMREQQRLLREAQRAGAVVLREAKRAAKQTGVVVDRERSAGVPRVVGFTWGKPIPRRTIAEMRRAWSANRRKNDAPKPRCKCGECPECARRKKHTEYVRNRRAGRAMEGTAE